MQLYLDDVTKVPYDPSPRKLASYAVIPTSDPGLTSGAGSCADQLHAALWVGGVRSFGAGEVSDGSTGEGAARAT